MTKVISRARTRRSNLCRKATCFISSFFCTVMAFSAFTFCFAEDLQLGEEERWIVVASRKDMLEAIDFMERYTSLPARVVKSKNEWLAVVLGPVPVLSIEQARISYPEEPLPDDAFLSSGGTFVYTVWTSRHKWIVVASRQSLPEAIDVARKYDGARVVRAENGWYAVVLEPVEATDMTAFRASYTGRALPEDAFLSRGGKFMATAWDGDTPVAVAAPATGAAAPVAGAVQQGGPARVTVGPAARPAMMKNAGRGLKNFLGAVTGVVGKVVGAGGAVLKGGSEVVLGVGGATLQAGGSLVEGVAGAALEGGGAVLQSGVIESVAGAAIQGAGAYYSARGYSAGGYSGGGYSGGGGSAVSLPTGTGYSQRGSFEDCVAMYRAAGQPGMAAQCQTSATNMDSLR
ncbi:hypothetical protein MWN33_14020 [Starkeya koreensis]|uniref:Uncharacterized protein n=1 Tax=Ancylobacter koreensis TaxID=266121 RepID=A0ABT0DPF0_9HYPH|nr:hypothetical protein [Ancylobacter koreensis]MCK0209148.1 hypothetical protein [Ancylobacter koreensis]